MSTPWQPGQLLTVGFEGLEIPRPLAEAIEQGRVGGVILFTRNLRDPHQVRTLVKDLRALAPERAPLVVSIDQEGGRVQRLRAPWTQWPPMRRFGEVNDLDSTRQMARALAAELLTLGITLDYAPVVDVDTNPANPVIGDRSFGRTPELVSRHAEAFIGAMQEAGVAACAKHFPGHGDTANDSHLELPILPHGSHGLDRLRGVELPPFVAAANVGVASIMTAHVVFEAVDRKRPATISPDVMALLREEIGYDGLVFSDDLEMKAVADHFRPRELVEGTLGAGVDALLVCSRWDLAQEILQWLERAPDAMLERALERMVAFKARFGGPVSPEPDEFDPPPYPEHEALVERMR